MYSKTLDVLYKLIAVIGIGTAFVMTRESDFQTNGPAWPWMLEYSG